MTAIKECGRKECVNNKEMKCLRSGIQLNFRGACHNYVAEYEKDLTQCEQAITSAVATELNKFKKTGYSFEAFDIRVELDNVDTVDGPETIVSAITINAKVMV